MSDKTGIEWADATWNPIVGCSIVSKGCTNCYAMKVAARLESISVAHETKNGGDPGPLYYYRDLTKDTRSGPVWTGRVALAPEHILTQPLRWNRPRRIFVNSMGDLFHEDVPAEWIDQVFTVMALARHHTFLVLTKRPEKMREYVSKNVAAAACRLAMESIALQWGCDPRGADNDGFDWLAHHQLLPNVWLGVSIEDQESAGARIPALLETPAAGRFVSAEPLLGPVTLQSYGTGTRMNWVICGGESGPDARPMHPDWARGLRDQCIAADVPFFFKQWGEWMPWEWGPPPLLVSQHGQMMDRHHLPQDETGELKDGWDDGLSYVSEGEAHVLFERIGKKRAGRTLDGRTWEEFP